MKKYLFVAILAVISVMAYAQPRAIGGRLGYGAEFSYEHTMDEKNMISLEVGVPGFKGLEVACTYDWIDPFNAVVPWNEKGEWHWYMGVGGALQTWGWGFSNLFAGVAGRFGIEYDFWFPLQLSIDFRPTIGALAGRDANGNAFMGFGYDVYASGLGLGIRYKF
jgi:hypothetical protein